MNNIQEKFTISLLFPVIISYFSNKNYEYIFIYLIDIKL
jgi:hypothetical protein